jgi:hypothetical protein
MSETAIQESITIKVVETVKGRPRVMEGARVGLRPVFDLEKGTNALKTGISREEWKEYYFPTLGDYDKFYADFMVILTNQPRTFDLAEPLNKITAALLRNHPYVATDSTKINKDTLFVLYDEVAEAKKENKAFEHELTAYKYLHDMSQIERAQFLKLFGVRNTENVTPEIVSKRLKDKAKDNPKLFVEMYEDKNREIKILVEDLLQKHIVKRVGGVYMFGDGSDAITLGLTIEQCVEFVKDPKNNSLVVQFTKLLEDKAKKK